MTKECCEGEGIPQKKKRRRFPNTARHPGSMTAEEAQGVIDGWLAMLCGLETYCDTMRAKIAAIEKMKGIKAKGVYVHENVE